MSILAAAEYTGAIHFSIAQERNWTANGAENQLVFLEVLDINLTSPIWKSLFQTTQSVPTLTPEEKFHFTLSLHDMEARAFMQVPLLSSNAEWTISNQFMINNADFVNRFIQANLL